MSLRRYLKPIEVKEKHRRGDRCKHRHPNWHAIRCDLGDFDHLFHSADEDRFVWHDERRGWNR